VIGLEPWCLCCSSLYSLPNVSVSSSDRLLSFNYIGSRYTTSSWANNQSGRPHEELVVGTAMDRPVPFSDPCTVAHDDNRELYCCGHMRCLVCYDTRDKCKAKCQSPLTICNWWSPINDCMICAILKAIHGALTTVIPYL
jgi:hypothetical protein